MEASHSWPPCGTWQLAHCVSSACGRPTVVWLAPVTKLTSSWQEAQAARLGNVYQLEACVAGAAWHVVQLRMSCGKTTVEKSLTDCALPMMIYGVPALTLGRFD